MGTPLSNRVEIVHWLIKNLSLFPNFNFGFREGAKIYNLKPRQIERIYWAYIKHGRKITKFSKEDYEKPVKDIQIEIEKTKGFSKKRLKENFEGASKTRTALRKGVKTLKEDDMLEENRFKIERCPGYDPLYWSEIKIEKEFLKYQFQLIKGQIIWGHPKDVKWAVSEKGIMGARSLNE